MHESNMDRIFRLWPRKYSDKMYTAVEETSLDLDMLDKKDNANIKFKRVNEQTGKEVAWENIVRGFKIEIKEVNKKLHPSQFTLKNTAERLKKKGDLFKPVITLSNDIERALNLLSK